MYRFCNVFFLFLFFVFIFFAISWATPAAYVGSKARSRIEAVAAGLHQSRSKARDQTPNLMVPSRIR